MLGDYVGDTSHPNFLENSVMHTESDEWYPKILFRDLVPKPLSRFFRSLASVRDSSIQQDWKDESSEDPSFRPSAQIPAVQHTFIL